MLYMDRGGAVLLGRYVTILDHPSVDDKVIDGADNYRRPVRSNRVRQG